MDGIDIRRATVTDAAGIARVHWQSHQTTYVATGRIAREHVESWTLGDREERWSTNLAIAEGRIDPPEGFHRMEIWVAVVHEPGGDDQEVDRVVGWANTSGGRDGDGPRDLELEGLYVLDEFHGAGVGQGLVDAALDGRPAYLWVLADNPRARAFYRRNGFEPDGAEKVDAQWEVHEIRLVR